MLRKLGSLLLLWLVLLLLALSTGWNAVWMLVYSLGLLVVGSALWAHWNVFGLELRRRHRVTRVQVGDTFVEQAVLEATTGLSQWWPRLWLELHDASDFPGHHLDGVMSLGIVGHKVWELRSVCTRRGRFSLGPVWVTSGDPFGLFRVSRKLTDGTSVVVYPRTVALPRFGRVPGELPGGSLQGVRVQFSTPNVSSVREYRPGDAFNRIHWPTTARTTRMMVREFELDPTADVWIVLDLNVDVHTGSGLESTEEYAVTAAASLARHLLDQGRAVGLVSQTATLPADRGPRQLERILEVLALVRASSPLTLSALLSAETSRFARSSTLVIVTASTNEAWARFCQALGGRGVHTNAVLIEAATFGTAASTLLLVSSLAAAHIPTYMVKRGDRLEVALSSPRADMRRGYRP
jgi:uncharacterized protein (DUF58 family)